MSMVICKDCDRLFDSDDDPECFVEVGNMRRMNWTETVCEPCREARYELLEREPKMPPDWEPPFGQQVIIDKENALPCDDEGRVIEDDE